MRLAAPPHANGLVEELAAVLVDAAAEQASRASLMKTTTAVPSAKTAVEEVGEGDGSTDALPSGG